MEYLIQQDRIVYALGETLLDMVTNDGLKFRAIPGGSVLNASVSMARTGVSVDLISEFGNDKAGNLINGFLSSNNVGTDYCVKYPGNKTSLALAFLDENKNASYAFYHDTPDELPDTTLPAFKKDDILLFGSIYSVKPTREVFVEKILHQASLAGSLVFFDPNVRKAHPDNLDALMPRFFHLFQNSSIVKGSDEDFFSLFGTNNPEAIYAIMNVFCKYLIITNGAGPVILFTPKFRKTYNVPALKPISTIGAGDNFNAGFIVGLLTLGINSENIADAGSDEWDILLGCAIGFSTMTCMSETNYIVKTPEPDFWKKYI